MSKSKIEWTERTWNPVTGCTKVSQGCKNCYAEREWTRLSANLKHVAYGRKFTDVRFHPERLDYPLRVKKPSMFFVNSMSDLFHDDIEFEQIIEVFHIMHKAHWHTFQILTKREQRMLEFMCDWAPNCYSAPEIPLPNVWLGISAENQETFDDRYRWLGKINAAVRFVSLEPLLSEIRIRDFEYDLQHQMIDWVIVGGESGPNARPMHPDWVRSLRDQCIKAHVAFFFKQWGEWIPCDQWHRREEQYLWKWSDDGRTRFLHTGKKIAGRLLDGEEWNEFPETFHAD